MGNSSTIDILPADTVVGPAGSMVALDAVCVEGGVAYTHNWGGKHVTANLFGAQLQARVLDLMRWRYVMVSIWRLKKAI